MHDLMDNFISRQERRLPWNLNARDLGGFPTNDGRRTRWRSIVRTDYLTPFSVETQAAIAAYGMRTVLDLRTQSQAGRTPSPFAAQNEHGVAYVNISFTGLPDTASQEFTTVSNEYRLLAERFSQVANNVMTTIANAPPGGLLIHCEYGKDRTGLVCALLLDLVGVPRDIIAADHMLSGVCLQPNFDDFLENGPGERHDREAELALFLPQADSLLGVLNNIDDLYGNVATYLHACGVADHRLEAVRKRITE